LPEGEGFGPASIEDRQALRENVRSFVSRLREIGFFRDLSDAYVTQTVTPRYRIEDTAQETSS
jgi:chromosome condensin MukBEF MukE localization factor